MSTTDRKGRLYRMLWRWHFYAGVFCIPFIIVLALSGSLYLFHPQIEAFLDRDLLRLERVGAPLAQDALAAKAMAQIPGSKLAQIVLPEHPDQAARVVVSHNGDRTHVYLHPDTGAVLKQVSENDRFRRVVSTLHGELLMGKPGTLLVELAACWAIVMILTGVYLWWPRNARGLAGVLWPRFGDKRRFWRDIHAVTGIWISALALFLLLTGLPWAFVWGEGFKAVRTITGSAPVQQDWVTSAAGEHADHLTDEQGQRPYAGHELSIDTIVARATTLDLAPPVVVNPPTQKSPYWAVKSDAANRPRRADVWLDPSTGAVAARQDFSERHVIDQVVGYGIAAHEGQLFGWVNQLLGLVAATGLVTLAVSAFVMWRKRAPSGVLGAPPPLPDMRVGFGLAAIILVAAIVLPVLGMSLVLIALLERVVLRHWPPARSWLGLNA